MGPPMTTSRSKSHVNGAHDAIAEEYRTVQGDDDHYHTVANPAKGEKPGERGAGPIKPTGYRPGRKSQKRRQEKKK
jgi:hypothetical protein